MTQRSILLSLDGLEIEVVRTRVKHVRITVRPPDGRVRVSAPAHVSDAVLISLLTPKLPWIHRKRAEIAEAPAARQPEYVTGETHRIRGRRYRLEVTEAAGKPRVALEGNTLLMRVRPGATREQRAVLLERWLRIDLLGRVEPMLAEWQPRLGVTASEVRVRRMRTRWGSCSVRARRVWLNLELSGRSDACLEYVLVHELLHLLEPSHGPAFWRLMDEHLPQWRERRAALKRVD